MRRAYAYGYPYPKAGRSGSRSTDVRPRRGPRRRARRSDRRRCGRAARPGSRSRTAIPARCPTGADPMTRRPEAARGRHSCTPGPARPPSRLRRSRAPARIPARRDPCAAAYARTAAGATGVIVSAGRAGLESARGTVLTITRYRRCASAESWPWPWSRPPSRSRARRKRRPLRRRREVKVAQVIERDVPVYVEAIGETRGSTEIEIRARVEGFIESVNFEEGSLVRKGQLLYTIDPRRSRPRWPRPRVRSPKPRRSSHARTRTSRATSRSSPRTRSRARSTRRRSRSRRRPRQRSRRRRRAASKSAEIDLCYTKVPRPSRARGQDRGLLGHARRSRAEHASDPHLAGRHDPRPRSRVPERDYLYYARQKQAPLAAGEATHYPFELVLADGTKHPQPGSLVFIDRTVDPTTGTILIEAAFPNPEGIVRPGQYARIRAAVDVKRGRDSRPPARGAASCRGSTTWRSSTGTTRSRCAWSRPRSGSARCGSSTRGSRRARRIVVEGLQKVRPGIKVRPRP